VPIFKEELVELQSAAKWNIKNVQERLDELGGDDPWDAMPTIEQLITLEMKTRIGMK